MSTVSEFITKCKTRVDSQNTRVDAYLKEATVRALKDVSHIRSLFMQGTFSFNTVVGQNEYGSSDTGFPKDVQEIDTMYAQLSSVLGSGNYLITGPVPIEQVRAVYLVGAQATYPSMWAWHHSKLIFAPTISGVVTVKGDYTKDAKRDTATGNLIASTDTTATNPWFDDGEQALMNAVLMDYYLAVAKDSTAAQLCQTIYANAIDAIRDDQIQRSLKGFQVGANYGGYSSS